MSQNDFVVGNQSAPNFRADMNDALQALASLSSGSTAPATTYANMLWYDTGTNLLKMRTEADDAWIDVAYLDQSANAFRLLDDTQVTNTSGTQTGLLGDQATSAWETGTATTESLVSPAKVKAAIDALVDVTDIPTTSLRAPTAGTGHIIMRLQDSVYGDEIAGPTYFPAQLHNRHDAASHLGVTCLVPGVITCYFQHRTTLNFGGRSSTVRILKNGVLLAEWVNTSNIFVARQLNVSVAVGDSIIFQQKSASVDPSAEWAFLRIYSNNPDMAVA